MDFFATCPTGFEQLLADELRALGIARVRPLKGQASFEGTLRDAYRVCLWSRLAGEEHFTVYSLTEGALKEEQKVDVYEPHHGPFEQDREETVYVLNGEETAKEEAEAVRDLYAKDENAVGFDQSLLPGEGENT